jgi:acyl-CoA thioester hydrolase
LCDFLRPVVYPATLHVGARVSKVGQTSIAMEYEVSDGVGKESNAGPYARGTSVAVLVDYRTMAKTRVPDPRGDREALSDYFGEQSAGCHVGSKSPYFVV